ncbi:hypothetical protein BDZ91DRAFT_557283 [Kalaharituber pfeilii]|nr:hypothetical protein BDZ91DRAFT_557283 [Kalaharituber pfeilii]
MCDSSPFSSFLSAHPAWASPRSPSLCPDYSFPPTSSYRRTSSTCSSVSPKSSIYHGRRGAVVASMESDCNSDLPTPLEQIRRGSISTAFNTMGINNAPLRGLPMPVMRHSQTYTQSLLSPPSSPREPPAMEIEETEEELEVAEEMREYDDRRFQRQIMSRLQALNRTHVEEAESEGIPSVTVEPTSKFTPPPSPRPFSSLELPARQSDRSGSGIGARCRARSLKPSPCSSAVPSPLPSPRLSKAGRRVSLPANSSAVPSASTGHTSARGAVKKSNSSMGSRRGSAKGWESLVVAGGLFKSGWSWESAYGKGVGDEGQ